MKYLKIKNAGVLDIRLVALMGGTTKANDKYKIGRFGTGLKYTLSYLFRNNIDFKVFCGTDEVQIKTETEDINGSTFEIICINGNRTSITAQMGEQWSAWMILRELWCNALDEGSPERSVVNDENGLHGEAGSTTFYIQITPEIQTVIDEWSSYFIQDEAPMWEDESFGVYMNQNNETLRLYKNGVLIYQHPNTISLFHYDIKQAEINELREFRGSVSFSILSALRSPGKEAISYFLQNIKEDHFEGSELDYDWFVSFADTWRDAIGHNRIAGKGSYGEYMSHGYDVDFSNVIELPKKVYGALIKQFEGVGVLAMSDDKVEFYETENLELKHRVSECISLLSSIGYEMNSEFKIRYGIFSNKNKLGACNKNKKTIMLSEVLKGQPDTEIVKVLIENNEYIPMRHDKQSPDFAAHFIDLYVRALLAKNEVEI